MNIVFKIILIIIFDSYSWYFIIFQALYMFGAATVFKKSGLKWYFALIPWFREYQLARCAFREPEGRIYCVLSFLTTLLAIFSALFDYFDDYNANITRITFLYVIVYISLLISCTIFDIHIYSGFTKVYGVSKAWIICSFSTITLFIPLMVWGLSKKYQPKWKVEDIKVEMYNLARYGPTSTMKDGLSVTLASRSVNDFFRKKYLLKDINVSIPTGHMVLLLGGSGAGKTTFLNAINGYEKADAKVMLDGRDMYKEYSKMKHNVGFVPQPQMMRDKDTVKKTLYDAADLRLSKDIKSKGKMKRVEDVLDIFGLTAVQDSLVGKLSGGQKKRLSICIELLSNPALFILDEPDSGLDGVMARELFAILRQIADEGKIVIVITHSPDRVVDFFDDVIVLAKDKAHVGRLAFHGTIDEAREFFGKDSMEEIVKSVNQVEEGGDGEAEMYIEKFKKVTQNG